MSQCNHEQDVHRYHDGELAPAAQEAFESHLRACGECARELDALRQLSGILRATPLPAPRGEVVARLRVPAFLASDRVVVRLSEYVAAAAAMIFLACGLWLWRVEERAASAPPAVWESLAAAPQAEMTTSADAETQVARWIVTSLTRESSND